MDHEGKESKTYVVKVKKYDTGTLKKIEMEFGFERANEKSWLQWKL
jgi:hypothetical protein